MGAEFQHKYQLQVLIFGDSIQSQIYTRSALFGVLFCFCYLIVGTEFQHKYQLQVLVFGDSVHRPTLV